MGIQGLLPLLKSIMVPIHIKDLDGCCVAVDTYSWLHKGALSCSKDLCKGQPTSRHIVYCMHRVNLLRHHGVKPILVFDGGLLPMKIEQENKRARARKENLERAIEHESTGNSAAAYECYQKAVDISPSVAYELIQVLKLENVDYIVAPYEADAQMTFLALRKQVDAVITEDSDLIPFGCPRIIFKMDKFGQGVEFQYSMLQQNKELSFTGFTKQMLLEMCILSGCDYLQSLPGMGLKRAHALIRKFKSYDKVRIIACALDADLVIKHLRYSTISVPSLYEESFKKALWTFQDTSIPQDIVKGIARGDLDPFTKMPFEGKIVGAVLDRAYPLKGFKPESDRKKLDLPAQKNVLTNYSCFASLEAKKNFRVPQNTPKHLDSLEDSSPSSGKLVTEDVACTISCSESPLDPGNPCNSIPSNASVEDGFATNGHQFLESPSLDGMKDMACKLSSPEHAVLRQSRHSIHKPCLASHKEGDCKTVSDAVEGKMRLVSGKVIVRSCYFQHKLINEKGPDDKNEKLFVNDGNANGVICNDTIRESSSFGSEDFKGAIMKRKAVSNDSVPTETLEAKYPRTNVSLSRKSNCAPNFDSRFMETDTEEGKFGCNISHLSHYSNIAEKSMEKFVSVMSSFRCASSGSRASGLRAPLKDVRNTYAIRSNIAPVNLGNFSYNYVLDASYPSNPFQLQAVTCLPCVGDGKADRTETLVLDVSEPIGYTTRSMSYVLITFL
ncbi:hypothetical protein HHK36_023453 [Tetracentron sinense]|uniref:Exonuclease 1 n=1 Tax=Tetracentron sinense TaxID=13715 RepID=A0A834YMM9_TETSI|nr:hypothetical protein HHK36_023453 [Tetracentron sinense]